MNFISNFKREFKEWLEFFIRNTPGTIGYAIRNFYFCVQDAGYRAFCKLQCVRVNAAFMQEAFGAFSFETLGNFKKMKL